MKKLRDTFNVLHMKSVDQSEINSSGFTDTDLYKFLEKKDLSEYNQFFLFVFSDCQGLMP